MGFADAMQRSSALVRPEDAMPKTLIVVCFALLFSTPTFAKSHDVFPLSCDVLWNAVKDTLANQNDYSVIAMDEAGQKASFVVVGETTPYRDLIALTAKGVECSMKLTVLQVGPDNSDERGFRKRLGKALARLQAATPAEKSSPTKGQE
jgi:hypothetical protein